MGVKKSFWLVMLNGFACWQLLFLIVQKSGKSDFFILKID